MPPAGLCGGIHVADAEGAAGNGRFVHVRGVQEPVVQDDDFTGFEFEVRGFGVFGQVIHLFFAEES